jgi:hypothetical protein
MALIILVGLAVRVECAVVAAPTGASETSDAIKFTGTDGTSASTITMPARDANGNNLTTGGLTEMTGKDYFLNGSVALMGLNSPPAFCNTISSER